MILRIKAPDAPQIEACRRASRGESVRYSDIGASLQMRAPKGFVVTQSRQRLPDGSFEAAKAALDDFAMFPSWVRPHGSSRLDAVVVVIVQLGVSLINLCRVVRRVDTPERYGFAYGTLNCHAECGEEAFMIEQRGDEVWYSVFSFSRPARAWLWLGYPLIRLLQHRFVRDSCAAMDAAVRSAG
ncbi:MAG: hypothetical protein ACI9U2_003046 [Bradymonadia bacterium]|jgi:uncharacterized protein (UPF0548 family)